MVDTRKVDGAGFEVLVGGDFAPKVSAATFEILAGGVYTPKVSGAAIEVLIDPAQFLANTTMQRLGGSKRHKIRKTG